VVVKKTTTVKAKATRTKATRAKRTPINLTKTNYARRTANIKALRLLIDNYTEQRCSACGLVQEDATRAAFHFHHLDPSKKLFAIGEIWTMFKDTPIATAWKKVEKELQKTILVCALCHARIHYEERQVIATTKAALKKLSPPASACP
jgi:hypothetical protein